MAGKKKPKKTMRKILLAALALFTITGSCFAQNLPSYVPANGLVGWWPFNGNANDESGNGNNGTVNGATLTTDRNNVANSAYFFNGSAINQDYIQTGNPIGNSDSFSMSFWISRSELSSNGKWSLMINSANNLPGSYEFICVEDTICFRNWGNLTAGLNFDIKQKFSLSNNSYFNVSVTSNFSTTKLFLNGQFVAETNIPKVKPIDGDLFIGKHANFGPPSNSSFYGKLDDIAIYNRALTQQEITALYQGGNTTANCPDLSGSLLQGLVGYWPFCGNANDESGNGNNGTINGATLTADRFGNQASAYRFDGQNDYVNLNSGFESGNSPKSFSIWFRSNDTKYRWLLSGGNNSDCNAFGLYQDSSHYAGNFNYDLFFHGNGLQCDYSFSDFFLDSWNHAIISFDGVKVHSYLNGVYKGNREVSLNTAGSIDVIAGARVGFSTFFKGSLDDIAIWNRALSQSEITQLYNQGICQQSITVTDTLLIHTGITSYNPIAYQNMLKVWPNPGNQDITIDAGNLSLMQGWKIKISNSLGQEVYPATLISQQQQLLDMSTWGGNGLYLLHLINPQGHITEVKKIVLAP